MSIDRIEPIRVVAPPKIDRLDRDRERHRDKGKQPQPERKPREDEVEDDGLPHIDVRA